MEVYKRLCFVLNPWIVLHSLALSLFRHPHDCVRWVFSWSLRTTHSFPQSQRHFHNTWPPFDRPHSYKTNRRPTGWPANSSFLPIQTSEIVCSEMRMCGRAFGCTFSIGLSSRTLLLSNLEGSFQVISDCNMVISGIFIADSLKDKDSEGFERIAGG